MSRPQSSRRPPSRPRPLSSLPPLQNISRRSSAGGGDNSLRLDKELQHVLFKEYDTGEQGKNEALHDAKSVLKEVSLDPMAQAMDKVLPRFLSPQTEEIHLVPQLPTTTTTTTKGKRSKTPRHALLTARPPAKGKTRQSKQVANATEETTPSVPNILAEAITNADTVRMTTSAPTIGSTTRQVSASSSSYVSQKTSWTNLKVTEMEDMEDLPRTTAAGSSITDVSMSMDLVAEKSKNVPKSDEDSKDDSEELPYTENLLEMPSDSEDADGVWKSDIVEITKAKSSPKGKSVATNVLELKYKEPEWPHQLFLNQILEKRTRLTHLILDGSELRFLRDLGRSLMSLMTLSVCDCGLRSLDGIYSMPNLRTLIARKNKITIPTQCSFLDNLSYLDLSSNPIEDFDPFGNLKQCRELRILKLQNTPISSNLKFHKRMQKLLPQLKEIHPPYFFVDQLLLTRKGDEQTEDKGVDQVAKGKENESGMPGMSFDKVVLEERKSGIAFQKIPNSKRKLQQNQNVEEGVNMGIFMGPKFLQHLQEAIPPPTAGASTDDEHVGGVAMTDEDKKNQRIIQEIFGRKNTDM